MMLCYALKHDSTRFAILRLRRASILELTSLHSQTIRYQAIGPDARRLYLQREATHHILNRKLIWQTIKCLDGLLLSAYVHIGIPYLIFEISLSHSSEIVTLTGILDIDDELSQAQPGANPPRPSRTSHTSTDRPASSDPNGASR